MNVAAHIQQYCRLSERLVVQKIKCSWEWFIAILNQRPLLITVLTGMAVYFVALVASVIAVLFIDDGLLYSFTCLVGAALVVGYHWVMTRYQATSRLAQCTHLLGALCFMWIALAIPIRLSLLMD